MNSDERALNALDRWLTRKPSRRAELVTEEVSGVRMVRVDLHDGVQLVSRVTRTLASHAMALAVGLVGWRTGVPETGRRYEVLLEQDGAFYQTLAVCVRLVANSASTRPYYWELESQTPGKVVGFRDPPEEHATHKDRPEDF